ncbi:L-threonylcarbamoyladenylate synthase [Candidatus Pelagibacter sp.]|nr:L-threonylcarbamoyladenylate synthase [Candidatus Pelagibacter sp.]
MKSIQSNIKKAKKYLDNNHCIAVPTETVYGLAANAYSTIAVRKVFRLKKRPMNNPLIVHYYNIDRLKIDCHINKNLVKLYKKFSPGPITYVLKLRKNSRISKYVTNNKKSIAVRFPKHKLLRNLLKNLNYPLAAPSANISTRLSSVKPSDVKEEFGSKIKYVLDGGKSKIGVESTILNLLEKPSLLRYGGLDTKKIENILKRKLLINTNSKKKLSPGLFPLHYSPGIPLRINVKKPKKDEAYLLIKKRKPNLKNYYYLSKVKNIEEAAKNLYSTLRKIKNDGFKMVAIEKIPNKGLGKTINDRLKRASKY